jgi:hypothetical protein
MTEAKQIILNLANLEVQKRELSTTVVCYSINVATLQVTHGGLEQKLEGAQDMSG